MKRERLDCPYDFTSRCTMGRCDCKPKQEMENQQQNEWKTVLEETPPSNIELLVQSPRGTNHLASWRESYSIFTCQEKSESSSLWKWKLI
jgi:hypothetical protein